MSYESDYLDTFFIVFWLFIFLLTLLTEMKLKQFNLLCFTIASLVAAICGIFFASTIYQCIIFISLSFILGIAFYPIMKKRKIKRIFDNQISTFIGREAIVTKTIEPKKVGEIKFYDITWEAISNCDFPTNKEEEVLITGKCGVILVVTKRQTQ
jgi:membrane protein implicated in regulation of membrane protease activity